MSISDDSLTHHILLLNINNSMNSYFLIGVSINISNISITTYTNISFSLILQDMSKALFNRTLSFLHSQLHSDHLSNLNPVNKGNCICLLLY